MTEEITDNEPGNEQFQPVGISARIGIAAIKGYQYTFSALIGRTCRYAPTCSEYTETAIRRFGLWAGFWIGLARILRCHPLGSSGFDPVPGVLPETCRWYAPWRYGQWTGGHIDKESSQ